MLAIRCCAPIHVLRYDNDNYTRPGNNTAPYYIGSDIKFALLAPRASANMLALAPCTIQRVLIGARLRPVP